MSTELERVRQELCDYAPSKVHARDAHSKFMQLEAYLERLVREEVQRQTVEAAAKALKEALEREAASKGK